MNYALIIGIDHYEERPLSAAVHDAKSFHDWLRTTKLVENPDQNIHLLTSDEGNKLAMDLDIDIAINAIVKDARKHNTESNRLYFFFAGHGIGVTFSNTALCLRYWYSELPNYCISSLNYKDGLINKGVFDEILIFLDCCREYDYQTEMKVPGFDYQTKVGEKETRILTCYSTTYGKLSYEIPSMSSMQGDPDSKRGAFTSFLIDSLNGDAADESGNITALDLKKHIKMYFKNFVQKNNKLQDATADTEADGDSILICKVDKKIKAYEEPNYTIKFNRTSHVIIYNPSSEPVFDEDVNEGQEVKIYLVKGFHRLYDTVTKEEKFITNYNVNTVANEQF